MTDQSTEREVEGWHILPSHGSLGFSDGRIPRIGKWEKALKIGYDFWRRDFPKTMLCRAGMHAAMTLSTAIQHAVKCGTFQEGCFLCRVVLRDDIKEDMVNSRNIAAAKERKILWYICLNEKDIGILRSYWCDGVRGDIFINGYICRQRDIGRESTQALQSGRKVYTKPKCTKRAHMSTYKGHELYEANW